MNEIEIDALAMTVANELRERQMREARRETTADPRAEAPAEARRAEATHTAERTTHAP